MRFWAVNAICFHFEDNFPEENFFFSPMLCTKMCVKLIFCVNIYLGYMVSNGNRFSFIEIMNRKWLMQCTHKIINVNNLHFCVDSATTTDLLRRIRYGFSMLEILHSTSLKNPHRFLDRWNVKVPKKLICGVIKT